METVLVPFTEALFVLAYRTLIFRISQLRGSAKVAVDALKEQMDEGNWYAAGLVVPQVSDLSAVLTELYRLKTGFGSRLLKEPPGVHLIPNPPKDTDGRREDRGRGVR